MAELRRDAGRIGLLFSGIGGMVGSGWLFGALNAARIAGPAAVLSWVIGGFAVLLLAFVYAELSTLFPRPGAVIIFPDLCFGRLTATIYSWINFLAYVAVAPVEAVAVVTYANNFAPALVRPGSGVLSPMGLGVATALMAVFLVVNLLAIRLLLAFNSALTWWKLAVPALTVIVLLSVHAHMGNFTAHGFAPGGVGGVFAAVSGSGIIFTFLGFRQAIELAGESANPARGLPFAILGSVLLCLLLYLGLQIAFIAALSPASLAHGWANLSFSGISGPFAGLASGLGLTWLAGILYADAAISPAGAGIIYNTTAARVIYASAQTGIFPQFFTRLSDSGVPVASLGLGFATGLLFLLPLPSWQQLVTYLSSIGVLAYGIGPVVLFAFRRTLPEHEFPRPFRLAGAGVMSAGAFIVANLVVFWAGAAVADHLFGGLAIAFALFCLQQFIWHRGLGHLEWRGAWWLAPYFSGLWLITFLGPLHGTGRLSSLGGSLVMAAFSLCILWLARTCAQEPAVAKAALRGAADQNAQRS